jgi:hypothetical protein
MSGKLKPPIFLLGNVRSGTSMIQDLFGLHPEVVPWFEPRTIWIYADPRRRHDRFDATDASPRVASYIRSRFLRYQTENGGRRIMEKTPSNVLRIPYMNAIFPESRFLYLIREPLANLSSSELMWRLPIHRHKLWRRIKETPKSQLRHYVGRFAVDQARVRILRRRHVSIWGVRYPGIYDDLKRMSAEEVIATQWTRSSIRARDDVADLPAGSVLTMRYEDFVAEPVASFSRILEHFELEITNSIKMALRERVDAGRQQKWRRLDDTTINKCLPILRNEMSRHGYDIPEEYRESGGQL